MIADELNVPQTYVFEIVTGTSAMSIFLSAVTCPAQCGSTASFPYSPDLAPPDFFLFPRIKSMLKGKHRGSEEADQQAVTSELNSILVQACLKAYENWKTRWQQYIDAEGCYFKKP
ncbi:uncharacterized protein TNCV_2857191 [Trichonephila clavipes]|nr:uncharacterized protein TNCV_2857191 [Trichonephila clavipes]